MLSSVLLAAFTEEILFRGYLFRQLYRRAGWHFVPAVLFKWKTFVQDPGKVLVKAGVGSLRSSAFLGVFVVIYEGKSISPILKWN